MANIVKRAGKKLKRAGQSIREDAKRFGRNTAKERVRVTRVATGIGGFVVGVVAPVLAPVVVLAGATANKYNRSTQARQEGKSGRHARAAGRNEFVRTGIYGAAGALGGVATGILWPAATAAQPAAAPVAVPAAKSAPVIAAGASAPTALPGGLLPSQLVTNAAVSEVSAGLSIASGGGQLAIAPVSQAALASSILPAAVGGPIVSAPAAGSSWLASLGKILSGGAEYVSPLVPTALQQFLGKKPPVPEGSLPESVTDIYNNLSGGAPGSDPGGESSATAGEAEPMSPGKLLLVAGGAAAALVAAGLIYKKVA